MEYLLFRQTSIGMALCIFALNVKFVTLTLNCSAQGTWTQKVNFPGTGRYLAAGFSIGTKGYMGTGWDGGGATQDFWEFDPSGNIWTQKANFGGTARGYAVGFSIGAKGYIGTGAGAGWIYLNDFWEWDQATNIWTQRANFGGAGRLAAVGFSIGTKGYIGTGYDGADYKDFWEWNQSTNTWIQKANFGGTARSYAVGFSIGTKGYIGTGNDGTATRDFWEFDPSGNIWNQKADFGGTARWAAVGFPLCNKGYIGTGSFANNTIFYQDFWEWDPGTNTWSQQTNFAGTARGYVSGFSIGTKEYIGTGYNGSFLKDFWEFCPDTVCCNNTLNINISVQNIVCNGQCIGTATVTPLGGAIPYTYTWNSSPIQTTQTATGLCAGIYTVTVTDGTGSIATATVIITQPTALTTTVISTESTCGNNNGSATITASGGTLGYTYSWNPSGQTTSAATGLGAGNYTATITDANGCAQTQTITVVSSGSITSSQSANICSGTTYTLPGGALVSISGIYIDTLTSVGGCDSIITTTLTVDSVFTTIKSANICSGYTYTLPGGAVVSTGGAYIDTLASAGGCDSIITTTLTVDSTFTMSQSASICSGFAYTLPGGTVVSTGGIYNDTLSSSAGCDSIIATTLTVNPNPTAGAFSNVTITQGQSTTLTATGGGTYQWSPATGLSCTTCANPVATATPFLGAGGLIYCVTVTDANNCTDTACVTVTIEPIDCSSAGELYLPNALSPNGDGENDKLQIYYGTIACIKTFKLMIYNRWGEKVYDTTHPTAQWDGSFRGKTESAAVFVYYIEATLIGGEKINRKGNISLIR